MIIDRADNLTPDQLHHLEKRIDWSVQNVLFDSLLVKSKDERRSVYRHVAHRQKSLNWDKLSLRYGKNNFIVNCIGLPLKYKPYYNFMAWLFSKIKK